MKYLVVGLGGFVGANARLMLGTWAVRRWGGAFPYGTVLINIAGSFLLGLFASLSLRLAWHDSWRLLIAIGFLGAFTTFSTFEYDTLQLVSDGAWARALLNILISVAAGFAAVALGFAMGRLGAGAR